MDARTQILHEVEAFLIATGMADSTFGKAAVRDGKFVRRLREGKNITLSTIERAQRYMSEHRAQLGQAA